MKTLQSKERDRSQVQAAAFGKAACHGHFSRELPKQRRQPCRGQIKAGSFQETTCLIASQCLGTNHSRNASIHSTDITKHLPKAGVCSGP